MRPRRTFGFTSDGKLKRVDVTGGSPLTLGDMVGRGAWGSSDTILFTGMDGRLYRVAAAGGPSAPVTSLDASRQERTHAWPLFLPGGRRFIFAAMSTDSQKGALFLASLDSIDRTQLLQGVSVVAYADGHLFYHRDGTLIARPFDVKAGVLSGEETRIVEGVDFSPWFGGAMFSVSATGTLAYRAGDPYSARTLTWFDRDGKRAGTVGQPGVMRGFDIAPNGRTVVVSLRDASGQYDLWTIDVERNVASRLTSDPANDTRPLWSRDGTHVYFTSNRNASWGIYRRAASGGGSDERLFDSPQALTSGSLASEYVLFRQNAGPRTKDDIWALPLSGDRKAFPVIESEFADVNPALSPDGRWIAYQSDESEGWQVYIQPFPTTGARVRVSTTTGANPVWSEDGRLLYYNTLDKQITVIDVTSPLRPGLPKTLFHHEGDFGIRFAGQRMLLASGGETRARPMTIVLNATAALRK